MRNGLVVEDLHESALWLERALTEAFPGMAVVRAETLRDGRAAVRHSVPDLALVDLDLPDGSGVDLIQELASDHPDCRCVVTTIFADDRHLFPALRAGAQGYLLKDQTMERIVASLQAIASGEPPLSPTIANRLLRVFNDERAECIDAHLSPREREALLLIAKGFKLADVAQLMGVTRNTAAGFVKTIYRKLKISSRAEAALEAARMGPDRQSVVNRLPQAAPQSRTTLGGIGEPLVQGVSAVLSSAYKRTRRGIPSKVFEPLP